MMVRADTCEPGKLYKLSRSEPGPTIFYEFLDQRQAARLVRRLEGRGKAITTEELAVVRGARAGDRIAVRYVRGVSVGKKFEYERYCAIPASYELREIKRPPGFARKRPRDDDDARTVNADV